MSAKFKPLKTLRTTRKRIEIDFESVSIVCALARLTKQKTYSFSQVRALATRFKKNLLPDE